MMSPENPTIPKRQMVESPSPNGSCLSYWVSHIFTFHHISIKLQVSNAPIFNTHTHTLFFAIPDMGEVYAAFVGLGPRFSRSLEGCSVAPF